MSLLVILLKIRVGITHEYWLASAIAFLKEHQISKMLLCQSSSDKNRGLRVGFVCGVFAYLDWVFLRERWTFCLFSACLVSLVGTSLLFCELWKTDLYSGRKVRSLRVSLDTISLKNTEKAPLFCEKTEIKVVFASCHHSTRICGYERSLTSYDI